MIAFGRSIRSSQMGSLMGSLAAALLLASLSACGDGSNSGAPTTSEATAGASESGGAGELAWSLDSTEQYGASQSASAQFGISNPQDVLHSGTRLVTTRTPLNSPLEDPLDGDTVQFIEQVHSDGVSRFALEALAPFDESLPPAADWQMFSILHSLRDGYYMRYRDFQVRNIVAFQEEWSFHELGTNVLVAGRLCRRVDAVHIRSGRAFELSIDLESQLILDQIEFDEDGELLLQVTYQTLDLEPNQTNVVWHDPTPLESFTSEGDVETTLGLDITLPTNLPPGYVLIGLDSLDTTLKSDPKGPWVRITFTNGVDPLFYLLSVPSAAASQAGALLDLEGNKLHALSLGRASAVYGVMPHAEVMAAGRVSVEELADLISSAIG